MWTMSVLRCVLPRLAMITLCTFFVACGFSSVKTDLRPDIAEANDFDSDALCTVSSHVEDYIRKHRDDRYAVHEGKPAASQFGTSAPSMARVLSTLAFICKTVQDDKENQRPSRLLDPDFLEMHFDFYLWKPDKSTASRIAGESKNERKAQLLRQIPENKVLLTKYYTKLLNGRAEKGGAFTQALYALPNDEQDLDTEQIADLEGSLTRFKYTRSDIIEGAMLDKALAKPLIWLSESALHDVLLQGTGVINDGHTQRYFNVHKNNGIAYDYSLGKSEQERYWYFAEVDGILGYGKDIEEKIRLRPGVSLAGDVEQLGLGKVFLIQYPVNGVMRKRMAVLADEGGAFKQNLFQLDLLVGSYYGWDDYYAANKHMPDYAEVWLMLRKAG